MPEGSTRQASLADILVPQRVERLTAINSAAGKLNKLGSQIVNNYLTSGDRFPNVECTDATWDRVTLAAAQTGVAALALSDKSTDFGRLWYSRIEPKGAWLKLPWMYRGKGAAGAIAYSGLGNLVEEADIWTGQLQPGALLQSWLVSDDYYRVRDGEEANNLGHSFIFLNYLHSATAITGMKVADNGFKGHQSSVNRGEFARWFGANHNSGVRQSELLY